MNKIFNKIFFLKDSVLFSYISGDFNPVHLKKGFGSKSIHRNIILHGINAVFWALEIFFSIHCKKKVCIRTIDISFKNPILLNKRIFLKIIFFNNKKYNFVIFDEQSEKISMMINISNALKVSDVTQKKENINLNTIFKAKKPDNLDNPICFKKYKKTNIKFNKNLFKKSYENVYKNLDKKFIGSLIKTSYLVGMKFPGKYSTFLSLNCKFNNSNQDLKYRLKSFDNRFNLLTINLKGVLNGEIKSVITPQPVTMQSEEKIIDYLSLSSKNLYRFYNKKKILVIGGSRGLGAYIVKILSILGAEVLFTYYNNKEDAKQTIKSLKKFSEVNVSTKKINILNFKKDFLNDFTPDQVYYMSTPFIGKVQNFSNPNLEKLSSFYNFYINGFVKLFNIYSAEKKIIFYYPSTSLLNENISKYSEYALIKKFGEDICKILNKKNYNKKIFIHRLQPLKTDQHLSLYKNIQLSDPLNTMVSVVKKMSELKNT